MMKRTSKAALSGFLAATLLAGMALPAFAEETDPKPEVKSELVGDFAVGTYPGFVPQGEDKSQADTHTPGFIKISHPLNQPSTRFTDPTAGETDEEKAANRAEHEKEVRPDGLLDYGGKIAEAKPGRQAPASLLEPDPQALRGNAEGTYPQDGDRGQSYAWTGIAYGDWMYVSTQYNSAGETANLMGHPLQKENLDNMYGGDYWTGEKDEARPGSTLSKINVKTGEVKILMSADKNGLDAQFRSSVEFKGKLYFCGAVNHVPSIYEVNPINDALQCVYQDATMLTYPGGLGAAWVEAKDVRRICPAIRGLTAMEDYLIISCVGMDGNPYISISADPSSGEFTKIARSWNPADRKWLPDEHRFTDKSDGVATGELLGYPAFRIQDSIFGGSIWEMAAYGNKLFVAICTGTPEISAAHEGWTHTATHDDDAEDGSHHKGDPIIDPNTGEPKVFIDTMQSFALVVGEYDETKGTPDDPAAWTWAPLAGDAADGAQYPFGLDLQRTRAGACNLAIFKDHLYIGEYNDTQIAFQNMNEKQFEFLLGNTEQSIAMYRMDLTGANADALKIQDGKLTGKPAIEKIIGESTDAFPNNITDGHPHQQEFGFGQHSSQYVWQSTVYNNELYFGTFDETMILRPLLKKFEEAMNQQQKTLSAAMDGVEAASIPGAENEPAAMSLVNNSQEWKNYVDSFGATSYSPVPASIFEQQPMVEVDGPFSLFRAFTTLLDLMTNRMHGGMTEQLIAMVQIDLLQQEIGRYCSLDHVEIPENLQPAVMAIDTKAPGGMDGANHPIVQVAQLLKGAVHGFDMYKTSDGVHFEQLTQRGLGGHYNQGLRAFAANNDPDNHWLCIGSANPFYGTEIWRMQDLANVKKVDPDQIRVDVKFENVKNGKSVQGDRNKGGEIYVNEGVTQVDPLDIVTIIPKGCVLADEETPIEVVQTENGKPSITVKVVVDKSVKLMFTTGKDEAGKPILVGDARDITVPASNKHVYRKDIRDYLPSVTTAEGVTTYYAFADEKITYDISKVVDKETEEVSYYAAVLVKPAAELSAEQQEKQAVYVDAGQLGDSILGNGTSISFVVNGNTIMTTKYIFEEGSELKPEEIAGSILVNEMQGAYRVEAVEGFPTYVKILPFYEDREISANEGVFVGLGGVDQNTSEPVKISRKAPSKPEGVAVSGTVTSYLDESEVTVELLDGETVAYTTTAADGKYAIENVAPGTYTMKVSKANHVTRTYEVVVADAAVTQDAEINPLGDVTGDGKVKSNDWNMMYKAINGTVTLEGYQFACADLNSDGKIKANDWNRVYKHINDIEKLW